LIHPDTSNLEIHLICPDGITVRLYRNGGRHGRDLWHTTLDDEAGDGAIIDDGQPPYTGTYKPDQSLGAMRSTRSAGTWKLRFTNGIPRPSSLLDWKLELRATPLAVNYSNYLSSLGIADSDAARRSYALARLPGDGTSELHPLEVTPSHFKMAHWRWAAPLDVSYSYERGLAGRWAGASPSGVFITRFPGGTEYRELEFPTPEARAYFRLRADLE
ncbi:MAG: hypothetical protein GY953_45350, partial [bacterium]|nr:hypothetical protein [bacterium]